MLKKALFTVLATLSVSWAAAVVNINTATADELQTLKGIGAKKAAAIVEFREKNGAFKTVEDLAKVNGIGLKTVEKLKPEIAISNQNTNQAKPVQPVTK